MRIRTLLLGFKNGKHSLGNNGGMFTDYKAPWRLERLAADFARASGNDTVYIVRGRDVYDPEYNKMDTLEYARKYGEIIYSKMEVTK